MTDIRILPPQAERIETGPVQFGDDGPGVFIRGDNAGYLAMTLKAILQDDDFQCSPLARIQLQGLQQTLAGAVLAPASELVALSSPKAPTSRLSRIAQRDNLVRHAYGGIYCYVGEATHTSSKEPLAVYEHIWPFEGAMWARPLVEYTARFTPVTREEVDQLMSGDRAQAQLSVLQAKEAAKGSPQ